MPYVEKVKVISLEGLKHALMKGVADAEKRFGSVSGAHVQDISVLARNGAVTEWHITLDVTIDS